MTELKIYISNIDNLFQTRIIHLRCFQDILSEPEVDVLLHLVIALINFSLENGIHLVECLFDILFKTSKLICQLLWQLLDTKSNSSTTSKSHRRDI